jgi:hypothetical protein
VQRDIKKNQSLWLRLVANGDKSCAGLVKRKRGNKVPSFIKQKAASSFAFCCLTNPALALHPTAKQNYKAKRCFKHNWGIGAREIFCYGGLAIHRDYTFYI